MAPLINKTLAVLAVTGVGVLAYAIYFDRRRRTDSKFRKQLRTSNFVTLRLFFLTTRSGREKKRLDKSVAQEVTADSASAVGFGELPTKEILEEMARVKDDQVPTSPEEREKYFMLQVEKGEQLCAGGAFAYLGLWKNHYSLYREGPEFAVEAALAFFRALRVYPSPVELIMIFQKTVPDHIFKVCVVTFTPSAMCSKPFRWC
jgi:import receptor subunit TOM20